MQQVTQGGSGSATMLSYKAKMPLSTILGNEEKKSNNAFNTVEPS